MSLSNLSARTSLVPFIKGDIGISIVCKNFAIAFADGKPPKSPSRGTYHAGIVLKTFRDGSNLKSPSGDLGVIKKKQLSETKLISSPP